LTLGHAISFNFHISLYWHCLGPFPSLFGDVGLHLRHLDHSRWFMNSYSHIIIRLLTSASDFAYTHLFFDWAESFDKLKRALSCISLVHFILAIPPIFNYFHFCEEYSRMLDKPLRALMGFNE